MRSRLVLDVIPELADALRAKCKASGVPYTDVLRTFAERWVAYANFHYALIPPDVVQYWLSAMADMGLLDSEQKASPSAPPAEEVFWAADHLGSLPDDHHLDIVRSLQTVMRILQGMAVHQSDERTIRAAEEVMHLVTGEIAVSQELLNRMRLTHLDADPVLPGPPITDAGGQ